MAGTEIEQICRFLTEAEHTHQRQIRSQSFQQCSLVHTNTTYRIMCKVGVTVITVKPVDVKNKKIEVRTKNAEV